MVAAGRCGLGQNYSPALHQTKRQTVHCEHPFWFNAYEKSDVWGAGEGWEI